LLDVRCLVVIGGKRTRVRDGSKSTFKTASFSDELGLRTNTDLQRMFDGDRYRALFPGTKLGRRGETWHPKARH
jgi:hypothetical protein